MQPQIRPTEVFLRHAADRFFHAESFCAQHAVILNAAPMVELATPVQLASDAGNRQGWPQQEVVWPIKNAHTLAVTAPSTRKDRTENTAASIVRRLAG